jgi:transcriptional regulator with XRE-family HTH domain
MSTAVLERTSASRAFYEQPTPQLPAAHLSTIVGSTSASYYLPALLVITQADPAGLVVTELLRTVAPAIYEIRRLSGLTWDELAYLFGVSRQALHDWANGKTLKPQNFQKVASVLDAIHTARRTTAVETRAALLVALASGQRPIDLFRDGQNDDAVAALRTVQLPQLALSAPRDPERPYPVDFLDRSTEHPVAPSGPAATRRMRRARAPNR